MELVTFADQPLDQPEKYRDHPIGARAVDSAGND